MYFDIKKRLTDSKLDIIIILVSSSRCGGTGRRTGLKILRTNNPCRFDSGHLHQKDEF